MKTANSGSSMEHFNQLTPAEAERLALLMEECGEVIQVAGKILRHGYESHHPEGSPLDTNRALLTMELGHVRAAVQLLETAGDVSGAHLVNHSEDKLQRVGRWLHHQGAEINEEG